MYEQPYLQGLKMIVHWEDCVRFEPLQLLNFKNLMVKMMKKEN